MDEVDDADLVVEQVAALDLGKAGLEACVRVPHPQRPGIRVGHHGGARHWFDRPRHGDGVLEVGLPSSHSEATAGGTAKRDRQRQRGSKQPVALGGILVGKVDHPLRQPEDLGDPTGVELGEERRERPSHGQCRVADRFEQSHVLGGKQGCLTTVRLGWCSA